MKKMTLYDLLEVNEQASSDAIRAAFERLTRKWEEGGLGTPAMDADTHYNQIRDAYFTLSDAASRAGYDASLRRRKDDGTPAGARLSGRGMVDAEAKTGISPLLVILGALLLVMAVLFYMKSSRDRAIEIEKERIALERKRVEMEAAERARRLAQEEERVRLQEEERERRREAELARQRERERDSAYATAERVSTRLEHASEKAQREEERARERAQREQERLRYQAEQARSREAAEAQRRLEREQEALRRIEREYAEKRGGAIPTKPEEQPRLYRP